MYMCDPPCPNVKMGMTPPFSMGVNSPVSSLVNPNCTSGSSTGVQKPSSHVFPFSQAGLQPTGVPPVSLSFVFSLVPELFSFTFSFCPVPLSFETLSGVVLSEVLSEVLSFVGWDVDGVQPATNRNVRLSTDTNWNRNERTL